MGRINTWSVERLWIYWTSYYVMITERGYQRKKQWVTHTSVSLTSVCVCMVVVITLDPVLKEQALNAHIPQGPFPTPSGNYVLVYYKPHPPTGPPTGAGAKESSDNKLENEGP